jgi:acyl-CoA synthetase (AMP-forming)/AMP-acid ligase II
MGVNKFFERGFSRNPHGLCFADDKVQYTYTEVRTRRDNVVAELMRLGFVKGEKAAVFSKNMAAAIEAMLVIYRAGGVYVPLNPLTHISENAWMVQNYGVNTVFYQRALNTFIDTLRAECPGVTRWICLDAKEPNALAFEDLATKAAPTPPLVDVSPDDVVSIYSTGGTTGRPKGVMFTPTTWEMMAANMFAAFPRGEHIRYLIVSPITHAAGTVALLLLAEGASFYIHSKFDAEAIISAIETHRITHFYLPPTAIYMLLSHPGVEKRDFSSLKLFMYMSAPMSVEKLKQAIAIFGPVMTQYWGQTEAPCFCTQLAPAEHVVDDPKVVHRLASCGRPMLLTEVAVMDDEGNLLGADERGELVVRGKLVMAGYYNNPDATEEVSKFGWHHTGDIGYRDADGYYYLVDRKKDMIISGGFNVFPSEVEQVIFSHPAVQECAVVGTPDDKWGEAVVAVIELKPGEAAGADEILTLCKQRLGSVKTPKRVEFWPAIPRTAVGKVSKKEVRAHFWKDSGRKI